MQNQQDELNLATNGLLKELTAAHKVTLDMLLALQLQYAKDNERNKILFDALYKEIHFVDPSAHQRILQNIKNSAATYADEEAGANIAQAAQDVIFHVDLRA